MPQLAEQMLNSSISARSPGAMGLLSEPEVS